MITPPIIPEILRRMKKTPNFISYGNPLPQIKHKSEKIIIMGNGPSLNISIEKYEDIIKNNDCIVVNCFAMTPFYEMLRPSIYTLADPAYFTGRGEFKNTVQELLQQIVKKTSWSIRLIIPKSVEDSPFVKALQTNNNINILPYNDTTRIPNGMNPYCAWDGNISTPPIQTILNLCIYLSLYWGYPETYLIGADTSFISNLRVHQENNQLYSVESHFYKNEEVYRDQDLFDRTKMRPLHTPLWQELQAITNVFKNYEDLRKYADYKKLKIYNASEYSWIDAFERRTLE
jgi:hypothetical protein